MLIVLFLLTLIFCAQVGVEVARRESKVGNEANATLLILEGVILFLAWAATIYVATS